MRLTLSIAVLMCLTVLTVSPMWPSPVGQDLASEDTSWRVVDELGPGDRMAEVEYVGEHDGPLRIEVFSPAFTPWVRIYVDDSYEVKTMVSGGLALSALEPAVMRLDAIKGVRYRIEIRALYEPWGGPFEVISYERGTESLPESPERVQRTNQLKAHAEASGEPLLETRAALATFLPSVVVDEASVPELMRRFPGNQLVGLWDPRWQTLRLQFELVERFSDEKQMVEKAIEDSRSALGSDHPAIGAIQLQLASALWRTGAVMEAGDLIDAVLKQLDAAGRQGHPLYAEARLAKGRWLRRVGMLNQSRPHLEMARSEFEEAVGAGSLAASYAIEELGSLEWDRGDFESAAATLDLALRVRERSVGTTDLRLVSVLKRLGVAQMAKFVTLEESAVESSEPGQNQEGKKKDKKKSKKDQKPRAIPIVKATQPVFLRIADLTKESRQTIPRLDHVWALSVLASTSSQKSWTEEFVSESRWARSQLSLAGSYPPMKRRADHVSSWSPGLYLDAQKTYEMAAAYSLSTDVARDRAQSLLRGGELRKSKELLQRVASVAEGKLGPDHLETALARAELANQLWRSGGNLPEIADTMQQSLDAIRTDLGEDAIPESLLLTDLAAVKAEMGLFEEAVPLAFEARAKLTSQLSFSSTILSRYFARLAWTFREAGMYEEMEATLLAALADGSLTLCTALHLNKNLMLADLRVREGDLATARALVKAEVDRCGTQGALGKNLAPLKDILDENYEARKGRRKAKGLDDLHNKGKKRRKKLLIWGGIFVVAAPLAFFAVGAAGTAGVMSAASGSAAGGSGIASLVLIEGMVLTAAASPFMMAKGAADPNYKLAPVVDPIRESNYYEVVGAVLQDSGYYSESAALHRGAIKGMEKGAAKGHPRLSGLYADLAEVLWDSSGRREGEIAATDQKLARKAAEDSAEILDGFLHGSLSVLPEQQALKLVSSRPRPESILFSGVLHAVGSKDPWLEAAWKWTLRKRSLVLDELAFRHQEALESQSPETAQVWEDFVEARRRVATLWVRGPRAGYTHWPELKEAMEARKKAERALAATSTGFRSSSAQREVGLREVAAAMPAGAGLVEFVRVPVRPPGPGSYADHYVALILDGESGTRYADLGSASEIDSLVQTWLQDLRDTYETSKSKGLASPRADNTPGGDLREKIWDPIIRQLPTTDLVFVVLDGSLNQVHFPALPTQDGGYVIDENASIHVLSSGRDLVRLQRDRGSSVSGLLAMGNPDFDTADRATTSESADMAVYRGPQARCGALRGIQWRSLPETEIEVEEIASLYEEHGDVTLLMGAAATEDQLKREAPGKQYLHIATHGFFMQGDCPSAGAMDRGIGLIVPDSQVEDEAPALSDGTLSTLAFGENPLLLSGLVLAGANNAAAVEEGAEDGIVTAEELAALDLRGLRIAALSACDTGRGTVATGEGVFGLRRALEIAGAQTVLMSLWSVPDEAAREWMTGFYERKLAGTSVQEATQATSMELLQQLRQEGRATHPYLWAGFVAAGDWR